VRSTPNATLFVRRGVDRAEGQVGACKVDDTEYVSYYFAHSGEEDCLRGWNGSGTIFLAHCNTGCVFCQNAETSHGGNGEASSPRDIAEMALELRERGCHNINFVTPTHHSPQLVEAVCPGREGGLECPSSGTAGGTSAQRYSNALTVSSTCTCPT